MILATVQEVTMDGVTLLIDGEDAVTTKKYQSSTPVNPGDRVVLEEFGDTYQIMGKIRNLQSFDTSPSDGSYFYIQLKPFRTYLFVETAWSSSGGQKYAAKEIHAAIFASEKEGYSPLRLVIAGSTSTCPFETASIRSQVIYRKYYAFTHVAIIEL